MHIGYLGWLIRGTHMSHPLHLPYNLGGVFPWCLCPSTRHLARQVGGAIFIFVILAIFIDYASSTFGYA
jgi:hypothetical protein